VREDAHFTVGLADRRVLAMNGDRLEEEDARAPADAPVLAVADPRARQAATLSGAAVQ